MAGLGARASRPHAGQRPAFPGAVGSGSGGPLFGGWGMNSQCRKIGGYRFSGGKMQPGQAPAAAIPA